MKHARWQIVLGISLIALSASFYFAHYVLFKDAHHIFIYLLGDIAFVPIEVLIVTMIIHKLLEEREKRTRLEKLNMVIETFFSKMGSELLTSFSRSDPKLDEIRKELIISDKWTDAKFKTAGKNLKKRNYSVDIKNIDLQGLLDYLNGKRDFVLQLLSNPTMLEHEAFTDLLRAVMHVNEELSFRDDLAGLPDSDYDHLSGDIKRAYGLLVLEWLECMKYLKNNYPFLFSLAMRTNPFDKNASPVVR